MPPPPVIGFILVNGTDLYTTDLSFSVIPWQQDLTVFSYLQYKVGTMLKETALWNYCVSSVEVSLETLFITFHSILFLFLLIEV